MMEAIDIGILQDLISLGAVGFLAGVVLPIPFLAVGYVVEAVRAIIS